MLNSLTLKNFKPFEDQSFSLKKLTLISGLNSTGKSSLLVRIQVENARGGKIC